jgi:surfactin synthase thioesterase subunit
MLVGGAGVARGYLGRPQLTDERFIADRIGAAGGRLFCTGDRARYRADGTLEFLGRIDGQVKLRGHRLELEEVEAHLRACAGVRDAAVVVVELPAQGAQLVAHVVPAPDDPAPTQDELRTQLRRVLPPYMVPGAFVQAAALPLTRNGKVDRAALPAPAARTTAGGEEPRSALERSIAGAFADTLGLGGVGRDENFFDLGGHSLLLPMLAARVRKAAGCAVGIRALLESPTVASLAARLATAHAADPSVDEPPNAPARGRETRTRLFCFAHAGGSTTAFRTWARRLPADVEVVGVERPGQGARWQESAMSATRAVVADALRRITPQLDRPVALFGHSLGALVAFEVARVLEQEHGVVPRCLIVAGRRAPAIPSPEPHVHGLPDDAFLAAIRAVGVTPAELLDDPEMRAHLLPRLRAEVALSESYVLQETSRLACPILVCGGHDDVGVPLEQLAAWQAHTTSHCDVRLFSGDHFFIRSAETELLAAIARALSDPTSVRGACGDSIAGAA